MPCALQICTSVAEEPANLGEFPPQSLYLSSKLYYEVCLESSQPFWISRELVMWLWCNLAASQRRPYCSSV